jgi:hypothetical protein
VNVLCVGEEVPTGRWFLHRACEDGLALADKRGRLSLPRCRRGGRGGDDRPGRPAHDSTAGAALDGVVRRWEPPDARGQARPLVPTGVACVHTFIDTLA